MSNEQTHDTHEDRVPPGAIVIGVDGSDRDHSCIRYGAGAASRTGRPLHLLHAQDIAVELAAANPIAARGLAFVPDFVLDSGVLRDALAWTREEMDLALRASRGRAACAGAGRRCRSTGA